ncbi:MAG: Rieske 2Fe-2S domain-containing protein [Proteobacteria bacterium]|nr:Rieske 2Fe-2S domain-containing protein [Pseudomonadota bacterium]
MFVKNAWYCAGWDYDVTQAKASIVARKIAGERIVLFRKPDGGVVALEDRCAHRQAALSRGRKEGTGLRCMYHGLKFNEHGKCDEIPGQAVIPERACVRAYPVIEKDNWIWVWLGDPKLADPGLICFSVGPSHPGWHIKTSKMHVKANYRLEIANLADLGHLAWVHENTVGGSRKYCEMKPKHTLRARGMDTQYWLRSIPPTAAVAHLFPPDMRVDLSFDIQHTIPCNWIMHFRVFAAGTATEGESNGQLLLDSYTCQAVTPRDEDSVDYYYAWGPSNATDAPGLADMLKDTLDIAFREDADVLEAQHIRMQEQPDRKMLDIGLDAGPGKMLWLLDKMLKEEAAAATPAGALV